MQDAAAGVGWLFRAVAGPEGSCQIGGNLATNAGGVAVLRYGPMRELTLAWRRCCLDGSAGQSVRPAQEQHRLRPQQLLIGAEGTLGIITAATPLFPALEATATALVEVSSLADALALLHALQARFGDRLTAFELISGCACSCLVCHLPDVRPPFTPAMVRAAGAERRRQRGGAEPGTAEALGALRPQADTVLARHPRTRPAVGLARADFEAQKRDGPSIKHDIAVPLSQLARFIERADAALQQAFPAAGWVLWPCRRRQSALQRVVHPAGQCRSV